MSSPKSPAPSIDLPLPIGLLADAPPDLEALQRDVLALFDACAPGLRRYVMAFGLGPAAADDVVQEAFLALFRHLRLGRPRANLKGWLYRVAHNHALKHRARGRRWMGPPADSWPALLVPDPAPSPEDRLVEGERRARLRAAARALPDRDRRCLYLRAEGLNYRDIAGVLGVSLGTVAKSLARAFGQLTHVESR